MRTNRCLCFGLDDERTEQLQAVLWRHAMQITTHDAFYGLGKAWHEAPPAVVLLTPAAFPDHDLPEALQRIRREDPRVVVIVLLDQRDDALEQQVLDLGADDVVTAPICMETLACRILLRVRRRGWSLGNNHVLRLYSVTVDFKQMQVYRNGGTSLLSRGLADLLQYLLNHAGEVVPRQQIYEELWADHAVDPDGKNLAMQVSKLRKLIEPKGTRTPQILKNIHGVGYLLQLPDENEKEPRDNKKRLQHLVRETAENLTPS